MWRVISSNHHIVVSNDQGRIRKIPRNSLGVEQLNAEVKILKFLGRDVNLLSYG